MKYLILKDLPGAKSWDTIDLYDTTIDLLKEWFIEPIKEKSEYMWMKIEIDETLEPWTYYLKKW